MRSNRCTRMRSQFLCHFLSAAIVSGCLPATRVAVRTTPPDAASADALQRTRSSPAVYGSRLRVVTEADSWLGVPYLFGGITRDGVDCSGFVRNVFASAGMSLPRQSSEQATIGDNVAVTTARPGDLVFFNTSGAGVSHVGILLDYPAFIHASTSRGVIVSRLDEGYYRERLLFTRRVLP